MAFVGEAEYWPWDNAGKGTFGLMTKVLTGLIGAGVGSTMGVRAVPVGLIGLTHWGAKCMDICKRRERRSAGCSGEVFCGVGAWRSEEGTAIRIDSDYERSGQSTLEIRGSHTTRVRHLS